MQFTRLRLTGFKSFVDPTELLIEPGLTGIVGPNGCGKSNLVEALKWVMGETSAKQMRGGEMDDVIFSGTATRPARNIAEVSLTLDNADRGAPAALNEFDELEVTRRIERESGSAYKVNGKEVRARDVQLLFADAASGARSTALVSQGRIGAVIAAKPAERRLLLEEAAGITGLHSRRHEAELRLRAAEQNLARLDDILVTLDAQLQNLKKQARQASRYRNISDHVRKAEATLFHLRWTAALGQLDAARDQLKAAEAEVVGLTGRAAEAATAQAEAAAGLPELRQAEAVAAAELQRLTLARDALDAEERRVEAERHEGENRLLQVAGDTEREKVLAADAGEALARLDGERAAIEAARRDEEEAERASAGRLTVASEAVAEAESRLSRLTEEVAAAEAERAALTRALAELDERRRRLAARAAEFAGQRAAIEAAAVPPAALAEAEATVAAAEAGSVRAHGAAETAEAARVQALGAEQAAAVVRQEAETALARLKAEEQALAQVLEAGDPDLWPPMIDAVGVQPGYETALGAALGEDLTASADEAAPVRWQSLPPYDQPPSLPAGTEPLALFVQGPAALTRRLSQVGVVASAEDGARLADALRQGQRLVSRDGGLWRWDGFTVAVGTPTPAAARLEQRNRLKAVRERLHEAEADALRSREAAQAARLAAERAAQDERAARDAARAADQAAVKARETRAGLRQRAAENDSRLAGLVETAERLAADQAEVEARAGEGQAALAALPDPAEGRERVVALRAEVAERRAAQVECQGAHDHLRREVEARRRRFDEIGRETSSWRQRLDGATRQLQALEERRQALEADLARLAARPAEIADQRAHLLSAIETAAAARREAADRLAAAEGRLAEAERALRAAEGALAAAREERVRAEAAVEQGRQTCQGLAERIAERLDVVPDRLAEIAGIAEGEALPELEAVEKRLERLLREREGMGPVNLRAEQEANELIAQMEGLQNERGDLIQAIDKLRQGIAELNREGRERLLASFHEVDRHFQQLFVRLFGGGRAHLKLTEAEDPLEAGLEIMASPPGKKLTVLSLLSGGEQALTALSLLFAVFMTNPAPICVLDEVDAPLDDANVDRFCKLVSEIAHAGSTRFLVITHHRMTMARMDRLFGVTMSERGVSQLVSVDLSQAEEMRETA